MEETPKPTEENVISDYYSGYQELELQSAQSQIKKARNALFAVAGLTLVANLIVLGSTDELGGAPLAIAIFISLVFAGLALLTAKAPMVAIIIGLLLFIGLWVLDIIVLGPEYIVRGIIFKAAVIYFLATGIKHAKEAERLKKEINQNK